MIIAKIKARRAFARSQTFQIAGIEVGDSATFYRDQSKKRPRLAWPGNDFGR